MDIKYRQPRSGLAPLMLSNVFLLKIPGKKPASNNPNSVRQIRRPVKSLVMPMQIVMVPNQCLAGSPEATLESWSHPKPS